MPDSPRDDDEEVQAVPGVSQVAFLPENPQRDHLDYHFHGKKGKDEIVEALPKERERDEKGAGRRAHGPAAGHRSFLLGGEGS